ncbi:hypothetical protein HU200_061885 [Digitaria exilis]|uniref:BPM/SPOP BACK domain-containing protein n=1 Tax=Digitaria exilis TaxID=1010633 RepID=A0A835A3M3_9POAL|nr:hypothetical protein HU200_061885 [Digitaria exilis]
MMYRRYGRCYSGLCRGTHSCQELKKKCINFFADEKNFKKAVLTELVHKVPSILAELRDKVEGHREAAMHACDSI